eukprot:149652-Prorocentrum_lima.AAC.1
MASTQPMLAIGGCFNTKIESFQHNPTLDAVAGRNANCTAQGAEYSTTAAANMIATDCLY